MSTFCGGTDGSIPAMTSNELSQLFPSGILPSTMPDMSKGLATEDWIKNYVQTLEQNGTLPKPINMDSVKSNMFDSPETADPLASYVSSDNTFLDNLKKEYCHYEKRYFASLSMFLDAVAQSSLQGQQTAAATIQLQLDTTRTLNQKLTLLTQIVNGIAVYRYKTAKDYNSNINTINDQLRGRQEKLMKQNEILKKESASADLNKKMVEYTTEKNKANQNLLSLYGVLNIVALAMIFYIART
jgi:hypothetical protein